LGPNGAGKTTLLIMLSTLIKPTGGTATVNGYDIIKEPSKVRGSIGVVFQDPSSDDMLTGYENLKLHAMMFGVARNEWEERIEHALNLVDLKDRAHDLVNKYSGGMRRRLELARGLLHRPKVLFLDEPTLGLDPNTRESIWGYIENLVEKEKVTVIITTHYMDEADRLCDRVAIIDFGKIVVMDTPQRLKRVVGGDIVRLKTRKEIKLDFDYIKKIEKSDREVCLTVEDAGEHLQEILSQIGAVESVEVRSPTLNDVFLHYTGREFREGSRGGPRDEPAEGGLIQRIIDRKARR